MLKGMEWIGSCKINAHNSGGEGTELVQHCARGGAGGGGVFLVEEKKAFIVVQRSSLASGRNGRLFCKHRNRSPAQTRTTWCGRLRTLFCFSPHLFSRRGASAGATPELPHEKRRGRGSIGWAANMSLHVGGGRRSKERRGQPKRGEVRRQ